MKFVSAILLLLASIVAASAQTLPASVPNTVGLGNNWVYNWTTAQYANKAALVNYLWNDQPTSVQNGGSGPPYPFQANVTFSSAYNAVVRANANQQTYGVNTLVPPTSACGGNCNLAWFKAHHPDWILYGSDQLHPAYFFDDATYIPINVLSGSSSGTAARLWWATNLAAPELNAGYNGISIDNIGLVPTTGSVNSPNPSYIAGTCSIVPTTGCTADGGTWTQLYASSSDAQYATDTLNWLTWLTNWVHTNYPGKSTTGNITLAPAGSFSSFTSIIGAVDIWLDEDGWSGDSTSPSACTKAGAGSGSTGANWIAKLSYITGLNSGAGPNALVSVNSMCPYNAWFQSGADSNFEMVEWVVGSYLLAKNNHSYLAPYWHNGSLCDSSYWCTGVYPQTTFPQFYLTYGPADAAYSVTGGVYSRSFNSGAFLVLVNPSTSSTVTYALGGTAYHRSDCTPFTGTISIPPTTGLILIKGASGGCIP